MKLKRIAILVLVLVMLSSFAMLFVGCDQKIADREYADVYMTTGTMSKLLARQSSLKFESYDSVDELESTGIVVTVDPTEKKQDFYGFGASLTHSSAYLLMQDGASATTEEMLNELFGKNGANLGLVRVPIGASDYIEGTEFFTCDDIDDSIERDDNFEHFTLEHDSNIIAVLKKILEINPEVKIFACPWSAPAWMKSNRSLIGGELAPTCRDAYAEYLVKFVEAYKAEGIEIDYLSLVNEPLVQSMEYPHMSLSATEAIEITDRLASKLRKKNLDVNIIGWEHNATMAAYNYADIVFDEDNGTDSMSAFAFHGYGNIYTISDGCQYIHENYPDKQIFMTEITEHTGSKDFASNLSYAAKNVTVDPINYGLTGGMFWNYVLRSDCTPTAVGHNNNECYGVLDMDYQDGEYIYSKHSSYYAMAHVSKFAYAIDGVYAKALEVDCSNKTQIVASALYRADGAIVVCAVNVSDKLSQKVHVVIGSKNVTVELQPQSVVTFVC